MHDVALDPAHPGRAAAIQRLRELGDEFTLAWLLEAGKPLVGELQTAVAERLANREPGALAERLLVLLGRAAWARVAEHPAALPAREVFELTARRADPAAWSAFDARFSGTSLSPEWDAGDQRFAVVRAMRELLAAVRGRC